jgi:hypothetical protein
MPWLLLNATSVAAADKDMSPEHAACIDKSNGVTDETKIKTLTGGDKITARFMKQDFFDFVPTFKLFICGTGHCVASQLRPRWSLALPK